MPPSNASENIPFRASLHFRYPKNRETTWKSGDAWLDDKRNDDGAEGLWRVHNNLYDLTDFIDEHPGGKMWLELTKGTDLTEAFECHHLSTKPEKILQKHFVRAARTPRNSPFTFEDDGFYRTLKRRTIPLLKDIPKKSARISDITTDGLFFGTFVFAILAVSTWNYLFGCISGILLGCATIASHNYLHKKDNFRMYYCDFSLMNFRQWRITHVLSHHLYPNTIIDFEVSLVEPFFNYLPKKKSWMVKYGSWILIFFFWANLFLMSLLKRIVAVVYLKRTKQLHWSNLVPFTLPAVMYLAAGQSLLSTIGMWLYIINCGSFFFNVIGFTAAHHHPEIFHDGDLPRSNDKYDWGMYQLDSVADRYEITGSPFLVLTTFGDHALHHLFPTLDHGSLQYLYGVLQEVMNEFDTNLRMKSQLEMVKGHFRQLAIEIPNSQKPYLAAN